MTKRIGLCWHLGIHNYNIEKWFTVIYCACKENGQFSAFGLKFDLGIDIPCQISYTTWHLGNWGTFLAIIGQFSTTHAQKRPHIYSRLKIWRLIWAFRARFPTIAGNYTMFKAIFVQAFTDYAQKTAIFLLSVN